MLISPINRRAPAHALSTFSLINSYLSRSLDIPTDEDYAEIDLPPSLSTDNIDSPGQFKSKSAKSSPEHTPAVKPRPQKPTPPTKPVLKPKPADDKGNEEVQKQLLRQHLQRKRESAKSTHKGEAAKTKETSKPSEAPATEKKPSKLVEAPVSEKKQLKFTPHPLGAFKHQPSYDEIPINQEIAVEHLPNRKSALDNDMWAKVKYPNAPPRKDSMGRRLSLSSGDLTLTSNSGSDYYSNLADLDLGGGTEGGKEETERAEFVRRSRSFSEHERVVIKATNANR